MVGIYTPNQIANLLGFKSKIKLEQQKILEIGCGVGDFLRNLSSKNEGKILSTDISPAMLLSGFLRGNFKGKQIEVAEASKYHKDKLYDLVIANFIIDTTPTPIDTIKSISANLRTGCKLLLSTPLPIRQTQTSGKVRFTVKGQEIGKSLNPLTDMESLKKSLEKFELMVKKIMVTTYKETDMGVFDELCAFVYVCEKN